MGQGTQLSEPRTPPSAPAPSATGRGGCEPQTQSRTPRPTLHQVPALRTARPRMGSRGRLQMSEWMKEQTSEWPCRDGRDGLLGRGGNVHRQDDQTRAHAEAGADADRQHCWASGPRTPWPSGVWALSWEDGLCRGESRCRNREDGTRPLELLRFLSFFRAPGVLGSVCCLGRASVHEQAAHRRRCQRSSSRVGFRAQAD